MAGHGFYSLETACDSGLFSFPFPISPSLRRRNMATNDTPPPARRLSPQEIADVLKLAIPAHLATLDPAGFPRIFLLGSSWKAEAFFFPTALHILLFQPFPRSPLLPLSF